jgi:hypothetical protein
VFGGFPVIGAPLIAVLQLLCTETNAAKWLFPQEKATFNDAGECICIREHL